MTRTVTYNAIRRVGKQIEEIRVTRPAGGSYKDQTETHVAWHANQTEAVRSMNVANGVGA